MLARQKSHRSHKAMDDTILRLFPIYCGGLPSVARKRSERAKSFLSPEVTIIVLSLACQTKLRKINNELGPPSHKASAGRLRDFTSFRSEVWWRRGESNPRPRIFHVGLYIHSPNLNFCPRDTFRTRWLKSYPDYMFASLRFRPLSSAILLVDAQICPRRKRQQDVSRLRS